MTRARLEQGLAAALGLWACGVQVHEVFATVGGWATVLAAAAWLVLSGTARTELRGWWPVGAFVGSAALFPLLAGHTPTGTGLARLLDVMLIPAMAVAARAVSERALTRVAAAAALVMVLSCIAAGLQHFGAWPKSETFSSLWWAQVPTDRVYEPVPGRTDRFMGGGLLLHRLRFANVTALATLIFFGLALHRRRWAVGALAIVGLSSVAVFPHARAATAAAVLGLAVVAAMGLRRRAVGLGLAAGVAALAATLTLVVPSVRERFAAAFDLRSSADRVALVNAGLEAVRAAPLSGLGAGRYKPSEWIASTPELPAEVLRHQGKAHNQFLTIAAEGGLGSLAAFLVLLAVMGWRAVRAGPDGSAALGVLTFFVASSLLHDPLFHAESSLALFGALGVTLGLCQRQPS